MDITAFKWIFFGLVLAGCVAGAWAHCLCFEALDEMARYGSEKRK